jgi:hypothetical protein
MRNCFARYHRPPRFACAFRGREKAQAPAPWITGTGPCLGGSGLRFPTPASRRPQGDPTQPSEIVEFTKSGKFVAEFNVDAAPDGAFGVGLAPAGSSTFRLVVVDDNANDLTVIDQDILAGD